MPTVRALFVGLVVIATPLQSASAINVRALSSQTHFHGVAAVRDAPGHIFLATHHGLYLVHDDGEADLLSERQDDFMGFTAHPTNANLLYASGHPANGGNLGFVMSADGGRTWTKVADGVNGPVDFHQIDVNRRYPQVIHGLHNGLQRSEDAGRTWRRVSAAIPANILDLATSPANTQIIYAATENGLVRSRNGGMNWEQAHAQQSAATMVQTTIGGDVFAFVVGVGLVRAKEPDLRWEILSENLGPEIIMHLAIDEQVPARIYAATVHGVSGAQSIMRSADGGRRWTRLGA